MSSLVLPSSTTHLQVNSSFDISHFMAIFFKCHANALLQTKLTVVCVWHQRRFAVD